MNIVKVPETATNVVEYEVTGNSIDFEDGSLMINLKKREADELRTIDICRDSFGDLVVGAASGDLYVAQIIIPARRYTDVVEDDETRTVPVPFDIDNCTLVLWEER